jgi:hypothetical protein
MRSVARHPSRSRNRPRGPTAGPQGWGPGPGEPRCPAPVRGCAVNSWSTIGRYPAGIRWSMRPLESVRHHRSRRARIRTFAWTIRRTVYEPEVNVWLMSKRMADLVSRRMAVFCKWTISRCLEPCKMRTSRCAAALPPLNALKDAALQAVGATSRVQGSLRFLRSFQPLSLVSAAIGRPIGPDTGQKNGRRIELQRAMRRPIGSGDAQTLHGPIWQRVLFAARTIQCDTRSRVPST